MVGLPRWKEHCWQQLRSGPKGTIAYARRNGVIVELTRLQLKSMAFDAESVAICFGLELARLMPGCVLSGFCDCSVRNRREIHPRTALLAAGTKLFPRAPAAHAIPTPYVLVSADFDFVAVAVSFFASW